MTEMTKKISKLYSNRKEKGFTLVELLIVLAILAVLAAVVIPSVTGMFGRGAEQALDTDSKTIQTSVATFFFDVHDGSPWETANGTAGHYYPTADGKVATTGGANPVDIATLLTAANAAGANYFNNAPAGTGALWMGLLVNAPDAAGGTENSTVAAPITGEKGPYLQEMPKSASAKNGSAMSPPGTYTWVVVKEAKVYPLYWDSSASLWKQGSAGTYP